MDHLILIEVSQRTILFDEKHWITNFGTCVALKPLWLINQFWHMRCQACFKPVTFIGDKSVWRNQVHIFNITHWWFLQLLSPIATQIFFDLMHFFWWFFYLVNSMSNLPIEVAPFNWAYVKLYHHLCEAFLCEMQLHCLAIIYKLTPLLTGINFW